MIEELCKRLREEPDLYYAYQSNIAMPFIDNMHWQASFSTDMDGSNTAYTVTSEQLHKIANDAAKQFLDLLIKPIEQ